MPLARLLPRLLPQRHDPSLGEEVSDVVPQHGGEHQHHERGQDGERDDPEEADVQTFPGDYFGTYSAADFEDFDEYARADDSDGDDEDYNPESSSSDSDDSSDFDYEEELGEGAWEPPVAASPPKSPSGIL